MKTWRCRYKEAEVVLEAANTSEAGKKAAEILAKEGIFVDEFCIDVVEEVDVYSITISLDLSKLADYGPKWEDEKTPVI